MWRNPGISKGKRSSPGRITEYADILAALSPSSRTRMLSIMPWLFSPWPESSGNTWTARQRTCRKPWKKALPIRSSLPWAAPANASKEHSQKLAQGNQRENRFRHGSGFGFAISGHRQLILFCHSRFPVIPVKHIQRFSFGNVHQWSGENWNLLAICTYKRNKYWPNKLFNDLRLKVSIVALKINFADIFLWFKKAKDYGQSLAFHTWINYTCLNNENNGTIVNNVRSVNNAQPVSYGC